VDDRGRALTEFTRRRKDNADAIADMALANFIEMRDKVGSRAFLLKKKLEKVLHRAAPTWFTPLYNMVTFSTIPYAEARATADRQARALRWIAVVAAAAVVLLLAAVLFWWTRA
jgi:kynurenine 3-monooxygenase